MKLAQVFQAVEETQFLKKLSLLDKLFFVGESAPLEYIKNFFDNCKQSDNNYYCDWVEPDAIAFGDRDLSSYQAIVVVSFQSEKSLFSQVKVAPLDIDLPILRLFADIFVNHMCQRPLLDTGNLAAKPDISYAILTTPRSGSTYLCDLLDSTKIAGHPREDLRLAAQELSLHCNFDYLKLLDSLRQCRTTDNGVFGTKLISHFLFELQQSKPDFPQIFKSIDKFILLIREDKVAQAVSLVLAQKTEVWHLYGSANNLDYRSQLDNIEIDRALLDDVEQKYHFINRQEDRLRRILANNQINPLEIIYEDILEDAPSQVNRILDFIGIVKPDPYIMQIESGIKKMPSSISQEIIRQYHQKNTVC